MQRRHLLKLSPIAAASAVGRIGFSQLPGQPAGAPAGFNVRSYGTTGDGKTVDTPAVNRAIGAVAAAGGGTLVFPAGTYLCFTIRLRSKVDLSLSHGCTILAADSHVEIAPSPGDTRPALWLEDVQRADFFAITASPARPNFALRKVADLRILWSRAAEDATLSTAENQDL